MRPSRRIRGRPALARRRPRGVAVVAVVVLMLLAGIVIVGMVLGGARDQDLTARRVETVRAFYAAEGGTNMGVRELMLDSDEDGDGAIGTISDDGDDANDPSLGMASVRVTAVDNGNGTTTLTSHGSAGASRREIAITVE